MHGKKRKLRRNKKKAQAAGPGWHNPTKVPSGKSIQAERKRNAELRVKTKSRRPENQASNADSLPPRLRPNRMGEWGVEDGNPHGDKLEAGAQPYYCWK